MGMEKTKKYIEIVNNVKTIHIWFEVRAIRGFEPDVECLKYWKS